MIEQGQPHHFFVKKNLTRGDLFTSLQKMSPIEHAYPDQRRYLVLFASFVIDLL